MDRKTVVTLSMCALAGLALVPITHALRRWRAEHLDFDVPIEEAQLFV